MEDWETDFRVQLYVLDPDSRTLPLGRMGFTYGEKQKKEEDTKWKSVQIHTQKHVLSDFNWRFFSCEM